MNSKDIVQYIVIRKDLLSKLSWSTGAVIAQACHASTAIIHMYKNDPATEEYLGDLDNMHKIILEIPDQERLLTLHEKLNQEGILHKLWVEQPENYPTCLALKPYSKVDVNQFLKKLKLFKS